MSIIEIFNLIRMTCPYGDRKLVGFENIFVIVTFSFTFIFIYIFTNKCAN